MLPLILAVLAALALLVGQHRTTVHGGRPTSHPTAETPASADVAAVMDVLSHHARALTSRQAAAWADDLDSSAAATGYAGRQRQVFDNLAQVPLSAWRYVLSAPVTNPDVIEPAAARLHAQVVILHVQLQYAFTAVDPAPTSKQLWLTAVHRGAGWKLAGDDDATALGGPSWRGPWDFGPLVALAGPHTLVLAHPAHRADERLFGALVEKSVPVVTSVWGPRWNDHVAVLIPNTAAEFTAVAGDLTDSAELAAVAVADQVDPDGTVLGARIVLNPTNLARLDPAGRRLVVQHELTHVASRAGTSDQMPTWLIEGFAEYVGNLHSGLPVTVSAAELSADVRAARLPTMLPTSAAFQSGPRSEQAYEGSWLACRLIAHRAGQAGLVRFYKVVSAAAETDPATAAAAGLRTVLGTDNAAFTAAWRDYLVSELT